jgi:hypothetical protein
VEPQELINLPLHEIIFDGNYDSEDTDLVQDHDHDIPHDEDYDPGDEDLIKYVDLVPHEDTGLVDLFHDKDVVWRQDENSSRC